MAELPPPPELPDVAVVTMVHRVKSRLGYTEINTPVPNFDEAVSEIISNIETNDSKAWVKIFL